MTNKKDNSGVWYISVSLCMIVLSIMLLVILTEEDITTTEQYIGVGSVLSIHGDVVVVDVEGELYEFYGSDLSIGQRLAVKLDDNGTTDKKDDVVVNVVLME